MVFPEGWEDYLDEGSRQLLDVCELNYNGNFDELMADLYERLYSRPMYPALERRLLESIERGEGIKLYREVDRFIRERIVGQDTEAG